MTLGNRDRWNGVAAPYLLEVEDNIQFADISEICVQCLHEQVNQLQERQLNW